MHLFFLILGIVVLITIFTSSQLRVLPRKVKLFTYLFILSITGVFLYIGISTIFEDYFLAYPAKTVEVFALSQFDDYNTDKERKNEEEVIDLSEETSYKECNDDEYCRQISNEDIFNAADIDTNKYVTVTELTNLVRKFDTNQNGKIELPFAGYKTVFGDSEKCESSEFHSAYFTHHGKHYRQ